MNVCLRIHAHTYIHTFTYYYAQVREAKMAKATFFATIGDKEKALAGYNETLEETVGSGGRIDVVFSIIRLGFCVDDADLIAKNLDKVQGFVDAGGDWERRNLLGIYQAAQLIQLRKFKEASVKLLDAIATFTCYQLFDYNTFVFLTVLIALPNLDRVTLRDKVIKAPEILSVIRDIPNLHELLFSLYKCDYSSFFKALSLISEQIKCDRFMAKHLGYYLREIRIVAYDQFLTSYKSVTVESMASAFGVSIGFLDKELSRFIAAGRINCKIDKVEGVVETIRPDAKNMQYAATLKEGDALLNRIQKLTKVISA